MPDEEDIREVIEAEKRRGIRRKPVDAEMRAKQRRLLADLREALKSGDERELRRTIAELDLKEGSPEIEELVRLFRALRGGGRRP